MKIAVLAKLGNKKLMDKIHPLLNSNIIEKVFIIRSLPGPKHPSIEYMKVPRFILMRNKFFRTAYTYIKGFFYLFKKDVDLIISYYFVPHGIFGIIYGKIFKKKVISCIIGTDLKYLEKKYLGSIIRKLLLNSEKIICTGLTRRMKLEKSIFSHINDPMIEIIPNTTSIPKEGGENFLKKDNQFLFIGRIDKNKRVKIIIESFNLFINQLENDKKKYSLLIVGKGPLLKEIKELIKKLNLSNNCKILGFQEKVSPYYKNSRYIILSSKSEGLPAVLLEGMKYGCIPITIDAGDITDLINSSNGFLISNRLDRNELIKKFSQKFKEVSELKHDQLLKISRNCIDTINKSYGYEQGGEKWKKLLSSLF